MWIVLLLGVFLIWMTSREEEYDPPDFSGPAHKAYERKVRENEALMGVLRRVQTGDNDD